MKYLVVMPEVAYITRNDGNGAIDSWDAPKGKLFQTQKTVEVDEDATASQAFRDVKFTDIKDK